MKRHKQLPSGALGARRDLRPKSASHHRDTTVATPQLPPESFDPPAVGTGADDIPAPYELATNKEVHP